MSSEVFCEFTAIKVEQRDVVYYLSALPASRIIALGRGLRRDQPASSILDVAHDDISDNLAVLKAIEQSKFAREVRRITDTGYGDDSPFQRIIDEARIIELAAYLVENDAILPNASILATRDDTEVNVAPLDDPTLVKVSLRSPDIHAVNIIDGQHRIEAIRSLIKDGRTEFSDFMVPFTLLVDLPFYLQAELFAIVNGKQKPVNRSRVYDLFGYRGLGDLEQQERAYRGELAIDRFSHHVVRVMNESTASPWNGWIKMRGIGRGVVTQAAFIDPLRQLTTPRKASSRLTILPVFGPQFQDADLTAIARVCIVFFRGIRRAWKEYWVSEETLKRSLFGKTTGVFVCFRVLHDMAVKRGSALEVTEDLSYELWKAVPSDIIENPPASGGGALQKDVYLNIMRHATNYKIDPECVEFVKMKEKLQKQGALV
jgi:DGQHR domain-containing protein